MRFKGPEEHVPGKQAVEGIIRKYNATAKSFSHSSVSIDTPLTFATHTTPSVIRLSVVGGRQTFCGFQGGKRFL